MLALLLLSSLAAAGPFRGPLEKPVMVSWQPGQSTDRVVVKLHDEVSGVPTFEGRRARPFVPVDHPVHADLERIAAEHGLARLTQYYELERPEGDAEAVAEAFNQMDWVELAYLAPAAQAPPGDITPVTPDFRPDQVWLDPAPEGIDRPFLHQWPGGRGESVSVADLEYSWDKSHEDLPIPAEQLLHGEDLEVYRFHGTSVLGQLFGADNGYGIDGVVPDAEAVLLSPYVNASIYSVAAAIVAALQHLGPGDVLLIEQQAYANGNYAPVEVDPMVFDAISTAVAAGIVVVEPTGNGFQDLDDEAFEGWFDRNLRDSGAIVVGGGVSPLAMGEARSWQPNASSYGSRVDVQGWVSHIVTTTNGEAAGAYADLFLPETESHPDGDPNQAYTQSFGGTSGAAPMVAGLAASMQSIHLALHGEPMAPGILRQLLADTGSPQPVDDPFRIGPLPDGRNALRYGMLP